MSAQVAHWRAVIRSYACETCGARPGQPCWTSGGTVADLEHVARQNATARCVKCGAMLHAVDDPGPLCGHCQLVRDLITEAHTTHQRET